VPEWRGWFLRSYGETMSSRQLSFATMISGLMIVYGMGGQAGLHNQPWVLEIAEIKT
jgi:hypothetical protein